MSISKREKKGIIRERVKKIIEVFDESYKEACCSLNYNKPHELLIATQLAAQCTDERVNIVTKELFTKYRTVQDFANASTKELEGDIMSTGFYRNKSRNIIKCCQMLINEFNGEIPDSLENILRLSGVGRKTANVVLGEIYSIPGIVIDTHAKRLSQRIGLTRNTDPVKIEFDLMDLVPKSNWTSFSHQLVFHGRQVCKARKPNCEECMIIDYCNYSEKVIK